MRKATLICVGLLACVATARAETPRRFAFEIKFGPYGPALDQTAGLNGATPFSNLMGDPNDPYGSPPARGLLSQGEFDYQIFNRFGSLGVGISAGYYRRANPGFMSLSKKDQGEVYCQVLPDGNGYKQFVGPDTQPMMEGKMRQYSWEDCISGEENILNVVPLALMAVYRFDVLDKRLRIPIIPYVKVGFGYYIWWFGKTSSYVSNVKTKSVGTELEEVSAQGATAGLVLNPGIAINLSALDPTAARAIDREIGLNRVTAFVELNAAFMEGWGARSVKLNLSDTTFSAGLGFEF
jgi:hypothetical protein